VTTAIVRDPDVGQQPRSAPAGLDVRGGDQLPAGATPTRPRTAQPPASLAGLHQLLARGVLVDLAGRPLTRRRCACGGSSLGETCPQSVTCPTCGLAGGRAGRPCCRPSGHRASRWHADRVAAAAAVDLARERAGDPTLPAPWPAATPAVTAREGSR
jgi:hypothetical protein